MSMKIVLTGLLGCMPIFVGCYDPANCGVDTVSAASEALCGASSPSIVTIRQDATEHDCEGERVCDVSLQVGNAQMILTSGEGTWAINEILISGDTVVSFDQQIELPASIEQESLSLTLSTGEASLSILGDEEIIVNMTVQ